MIASVFTSRLDDASSSTSSFRLRSSPRARASSCRSPRLFPSSAFSQGSRLPAIKPSQALLRKVTAITGHHRVELLWKRFDDGFAVRPLQRVPYLLVGADTLEVEILSHTELEEQGISA